jgi:calmodulin
MEKLTAEEISEFKDIFNLVDRAGRGFIDKEQLSELMDTLGIDATPAEVDIMLSEIDVDGNNEIDFDEFVAVMSRKVNANYSADQVKNAFKVFEGINPSGFVRAEALIRALCIYGKEKLTEEQAAELVSQLEVDSSGLVNYIDYVNMMMST